MSLRLSSKLLVFLVFYLLMSCDKKDDPTPDPDPFPSLSTYKDRFLAEAKARGYDLDFSGLDVRYVDEKIPEEGTTFCGYGYVNHSQTGRRTVLISKESSCGWINDSDLNREKFFFHEIGHAFLNLYHDDSFLCDGSPASLMHSDVRLYSYYLEKPELRKDYIDELFDRLAAETKCIEPKQDWVNNPVYFKHEGGDEQWTFHDAQGNFVGSRSTESPPYSLRISSVPGKNSTETGYWNTQLKVTNIPQGAKVTLRTKINSEGLVGTGAAIGMRVYEPQLFPLGAQLVETYVTGTESEPVTGKLTNHMLEISIPSYSRENTMLIPFAIMLPGTQGEVYFDNFEIIVGEP
ncbi:hypothetical protein SYJ56_11125 [Algoriphagus sp. D3-2-R+10]|uniref:hypothetical protein n=1 Tax=Algoriphagus aurantiacus TaxID=3103948 RepID=UPI002B37D44C|nr:hypothetical protein [Algoriphagus sp. D3-2-R+10]MEB2775861.1 hypothetical protein [Algoriphagus sp. D3-2-R+10]